MLDTDGEVNVNLAFNGPTGYTSDDYITIKWTNVPTMGVKFDQKWFQDGDYVREKKLRIKYNW